MLTFSGVSAFSSPAMTNGAPGGSRWMLLIRGRFWFVRL